MFSHTAWNHKKYLFLPKTFSNVINHKKLRKLSLAQVWLSQYTNAVHVLTSKATVIWRLYPSLGNFSSSSSTAKFIMFTRQAVALDATIKSQKWTTAGFILTLQLPVTRLCVSSFLMQQHMAQSQNVLMSLSSTYMDTYTVNYVYENIEKSYPDWGNVWSRIAPIQVHVRYPKSGTTWDQFC